MRHIAGFVLQNLKFTFRRKSAASYLELLRLVFDLINRRLLGERHRRRRECALRCRQLSGVRAVELRDAHRGTNDTEHFLCVEVLK